ncbi:MAG: translation elongation factor Ts [Mycoplasma sp.]|nr:translation elongation factor Ts [Mycoplasma sp.]
MDKLKLIKELREQTSASILEIKKALEKTDYDLEKSKLILNELGIKKAEKKSSNETHEGIINIVENDKKLVIYQINAQTDFVTRNEQFQDLVSKVGQVLLASNFDSVDQALNLKVDNITIKEFISSKIAIIGENIVLKQARIFEKTNTTIAYYIHTNKKIGAVVELEGGSFEIGKNIAMHVASMNPQFLNKHSISKEQMEKIENEINESPNLEGKPEEIKNRIISGLLNKKLAEVVLEMQEFVMEKMLVSEYAKTNNTKIINFYRLQV